MLRGFFGNLIFAIIARMLCGNHLNKYHSKHDTHTLKFAKICLLNRSVDRFFNCLLFCSFVDSFVRQSFLVRSSVRF